jgi:hypothetical protein
VLGCILDTCGLHTADGLGTLVLGPAHLRTSLRVFPSFTFLLEISVKIRYIAAVLALVSFSAHAGTTPNGLMLRNGLGINGLQLNGAPGTLVPANALVDLANRPLVVQD